MSNEVSRGKIIDQFQGPNLNPTNPSFNIPFDSMQGGFRSSGFIEREMGLKELQGGESSMIQKDYSYKRR
jgi:hypothetical protein